MESAQWTLPEQFDEYRLVRMLGRGSMGVVFLGHDLVLDRPVAIKFLNAVNADNRARERFLTEARAAARIQHPNVMGIYRVGELEGRLYIIGEYIRGHSLSELPRPMPWQGVLKLALGLARGLACAHRQGVLHRDIKLANAMTSDSGEVKLLDFSLAKLLEGANASAASPGPATSPNAAPTAPDLPDLQRLVIEPDGRLTRVTRVTRRTEPTCAADPTRASGPARVTQAAVDAVQALDGTIAPDPPGPSSSAPVKLVRMNDSSDATVVGTPYYMAPELWRAQPASRGSDVYALGVLLYILCSGAPPIDGNNTMELARRSQEVAPEPLRALAPAVDPRFAEIVDRCLRPPLERYPSADELCTALETLALGAGPAEVVRGNPYRGLQAFEARHRAVFFGRGAEIRAVVDRLRAEPFVLVAGDSGVGKSSLCRAGVLPVFTDQAIDRRVWATISLMPGRRPLQALVSALASTLGLQEDPLRDLLESDPAELIRMVARRQGKDHGLMLFVDQLEELVTLADRQQLQIVGRFLAELTGHISGVRLLATVRGDFLTRVAALPHIGSHVDAAIYLLTPLTREGVREAVVGPARLQDVDFDSDALIDELVTAGAEGSLPLMQFALAELWEARDAAARQITLHDLERIGRVTGALARHADNVVDALPAAQRIAVRRLLMRLVTIEDTRASLQRDDLALADPAQDAALEALVRGRLVVVREALEGTLYEIAHEALIRNWGTLQRWISDEREARQIRHRLETAALEWRRLGGAHLGLWARDQLAEGALLEPDTLRPRELQFLAAGHARLHRARRHKLLLAASLPVLLLALLLGLRLQHARALAQRVDHQLTQATRALAQARATQADAADLRAHALQRFDALQQDQGYQAWPAVKQSARAADRQFRGAIAQLERVLGLAPDNRAGHARLTDAFLERALAAELSGRRDLASETAERLPDGSPQRARWEAPGRLSLATTPSVSVTIAEYQRDPLTRRSLAGPARPLGATPLRDLSLPQGSYLLTLGPPERAIAYPLLIRRGEALALDLPLPAPARIPAGFVYIPPGRFLFGSPDDELLIEFFATAPEHQVDTGAYLIARHETTYAEWIAFLRALPADSRARFFPGDSTLAAADAGIRLSVDADLWRLTFTAGDHTYTAPEGQPLVYSERSHHIQQDWLRMPVSGIDIPGAAAYLAWLDATGRVPGARLCTDYEWERAARGADGRRYSHGDLLAPTDANILTTYGKPTAIGPDEVGSHPASRSPFGLEDTAGNVFEWVRSSLARDEYVARGSAFGFVAHSATAVNRTVLAPEYRDPAVGLRVCATPTY